MSTEQTPQAKDSKKVGMQYMQFAKAAQVPSPETGKVRVEDGKVIGWGKDNLYPNQLINMYLESPLHGGIVNGKVHFLVSGGLLYKGPDAAKWELINKNYESEYAIQDLSPEIARDLELFNGFAVKGKRRVGGGYVIEHVCFENMRMAEPDGDDEDAPPIWFIYDDWSNQQKARKNAERIEEFDPKRNQDEWVYVYMAKSKRPKQRMHRGGKLVDTPYPYPPYNSGLRAILTDIEIAKFDLGEAQNGFTVGTVMHFSDGIPDKEEKQDFEASIEDKTQGGDNAGGVMFTYSDGDSKKPLTIESLMGNNQPDRYNNKIKVIEDRILQAHSVTSGLLFGIKTAGQLGGTEELEMSYAIMKTNYFEAKRRLICDFMMSLFKELYQLEGELDFMDVGVHGIINVSTDEEQDTVGEVSLNGAQISGLIQILEQISIGLIERDAGQSMIEAAFPSIPKQLVQKLVAGTNVGVARSDDNPNQFSSHEFTDDESTRIVSMLSEVGRPADGVSIKSREVVYDPEQLEQSEKTLFEQYRVQKFQPDLTDMQDRVLGLIREGNGFGEIRAALDINSVELGGIYNELAALGLLDVDSGQLTPEGEQVGEDASPGIEILYSYGKRPDVAGPEILPDGRTRDFCAQLINLNRLYTRDEINTISMRADRNVWLFKGGWYHNPQTGENEPFCRHTWYQNVVEKS